jgi:hypothetical protein
VRVTDSLTEHLMGRRGVSKLIRRLQDENLVSLVQWLGPHRTASYGKPNRTIGRPLRKSFDLNGMSLTYLNGCQKQKPNGR